MKLYEAYLKEIIDRSKIELGPKPIDQADLVMETIDIILGPKSSNRDDALNHFIYNTLPGTTDAASVKAKFLKNLILEHDTIEEIDRNLAFELLSHMKGGPSVEVLLDLAFDKDAKIAEQAARVLKTQVFLYEADTIRLEKEFNAGNPVAHDILETELKSLEKSTPKTIQNTKRAKKVADEKWQYYEKTGHAEAIRATELSLHFAQQSYDYAKEEYEQLQKMYEADDLTEETEEIILRRAKSSFERASESLRLSKMRIDRELKITLPEQLKSNQAQNEMNEITHQDAMINLPRTLQQKKFDFEKSRRNLNKIEENLEKMKTDLNSFNVTSPTDGVLFYGMNKDGKWLTSAAVAKKLIPGGKLAAHEVFMTVIEPGALKLIAAIPEPKLANLKDGMVTHITPVSNPTLNLNGKIEKVNRVPGAYQLTTSIEGKNEELLPGMSAKLKIIAANYDKAITVPNNLINGDTVKVLVNDEKVDKKIKKGPSDGKVTVIIEGLTEGEKIVAN